MEAPHAFPGLTVAAQPWATNPIGALFFPIAKGETANSKKNFQLCNHALSPLCPTTSPDETKTVMKYHVAFPLLGTLK